MTSYDGTQREGPYEMTRFGLEQAGMNDYGEASVVYDHHKNIVGYTRNGVKYTTDHGMCSGNPQTSAGNSQNTGLTAASTLDKVFGPNENSKTAVMGDDNTSIVKESSHRKSGLTLEQAKTAIEESLKGYGFIPKVKIHTSLAKAEFCSGVFWPAVVNGVETYVLGAKPGKQLPKIGYATSRHKPEIVKGMFEGNKQAYHYVPLLNIYCEAMLRKMAGVKTGVYVDKEAQYKVLSVNQTVGISSMMSCFFEERYDLDYNVVQESLRDLLEDSTLDSSVHWEFMSALYEVDA